MEAMRETPTAADIVMLCARESANGEALATNIERKADANPMLGEVLMDTAADVRKIVGARATKVLEGNRAGEALQGVSGSSVIDPTKALRGESSDGGIIDRRALEDTVRHEDRHEEQAPAWNAESVTLDNGRTITRTAVSEFDAMSAQSSIVDVTSEYRRYHDLVLRNMTPETARKIAKSGDLLSLAA